MTSAGATPPQDALTEQAVKSELSELASKIRSLDILATVAAFGGLALGAIAAILLGPLAFLFGSVASAAAALGARLYARSQKDRVRKEISALYENKQIDEKEATELTARVEGLYTDHPERQKVGCHQ